MATTSIGYCGIAKALYAHSLHTRIKISANTMLSYRLPLASKVVVLLLIAVDLLTIVDSFHISTLSPRPYLRRSCCKSYNHRLANVLLIRKSQARLFVNTKSSDNTNSENDVVNTRRELLKNTLAISTLVSLPTLSSAVVTNEAAKTKVFTPGQAMGVDAAKARFREAQSSLQYLLDNYNTIVSNGGGDNVRRYLGTVGTTSGLYGITKVLRELQDEADDIVEFTENMSDFNYYLSAADTAVYSANFVEFSAAKTKPQKFFDDALGDAKKMQEYMNNMAKELRL